MLKNILYFFILSVANIHAVFATEYEGILEPIKESTLSFVERGVIATIKVKVGERIKKGQVLAVQESRSLDSELAVAKAKKLATAKLHLAQAIHAQKKQQLERLQLLSAEGMVKSFEVEQAKQEVAVAYAEIQWITEQQQLAELEYKHLQTKLEERTLRSPLEGIVTQLHKSVNEWVGDAPVLTVANMEKFKIILHIPTTQALALTQQQTVDVRFPGLKVAAITAKITAIAPTVDAGSDTISVTVQLDNPDKKLRSGIKCLVYTATAAVSP